MSLPPRLSLDNTILTSPLYRRSSHRANTSVDADIYPDQKTHVDSLHGNMSSSSREKATPPTSPVLRGRSPWRTSDVPVKTKRSRTLGRVAVLLMMLGVLGYALMGWGVCGDKCTATTEWLENGARRTGEYVGGGSVIPTLHGTEALARQQAALLASTFSSGSDSEVQREHIQQSAEQQGGMVQQPDEDEGVTRADMVDAMNGQGDHTAETELVESEPDHVHVQSMGVGGGGEGVMGSMEGGGGGGGF